MLKERRRGQRRNTARPGRDASAPGRRRATGSMTKTSRRMPSRTTTAKKEEPKPDRYRRRKVGGATVERTMTRNADGSKTKTTTVTKGGTTATRTKTKSVNKSGKVRTATKKKTTTVNTPAGSATVKKTKTSDAGYKTKGKYTRASSKKTGATVTRKSSKSGVVARGKGGKTVTTKTTNRKNPFSKGGTKSKAKGAANQGGRKRRRANRG